MGPLLYRSALVSIGNRYLDTWQYQNKQTGIKLGTESWVTLGLRDDLGSRQPVSYNRPDCAPSAARKVL